MAEEGTKPEASKSAETKNEKFKRLATKRVENAIKKVELIGHLSASSYESSPEEVEKIIAAIQAALDGVKEKFSSRKTSGPKFSL